jgi:hypothetical protein
MAAAGQVSRIAMRTPFVRKGRSMPPPEAPAFKPSRIVEVEVS